MQDKQSWRRVCIKDVCESIIDCVNKTAPTVEYQTEFKMIRTTNVKSGWIDLSDVKYVTQEVFERWTRRAIPKKGDVILTREAPLGEVGILRTNDKIFLGQRLVQYRANSKYLDNKFLLYAFQENDLQSQIKALGSGATVEHMRVPDAEKLTLRLPPLTMQHTIADILSAYDDLIENNTRRIAVLEEMAQMLYEEWFVKFRFPGYEQVRMVEAELGKMLEGWEVAAIGDIIQVLGGGTPSTKIPEYWNDGDIIWFSPTDLTSSATMFISDSAKKITSLGLKESSARLFPAYSVMMTSRATIGVVAINTKAACTNQGFIICIPNERLSAYQIYHWLMGNRQKINSLASGATFKEINRATFKQLQIAIPPENIGKLFDEFVHPIYKHVENLIQRNANLRRTRDILLPKLISGEIDVSSWVGGDAEVAAQELAASVVGAANV